MREHLRCDTCGTYIMNGLAGLVDHHVQRGKHGMSPCEQRQQRVRETPT